VEVATPETSGITSSAAVDIFQSVAGQLALPVKGPQEITKDAVEYLAHTANSRVTLLMWIEPKRIRFDAGFYGSSKEFTAAHEASVLFERALKDRRIPYTITNVTAIPPP